MIKVMAISEHFFPRLGGTVNYLHETLSALVRQGVKVELWVPGPEPTEWMLDNMAPPTYDVNWIDAGYPPRGDPSRADRYRFAEMVNEVAQSRAGARDAPDLLHLIFGLFVMQLLDTDALRDLGLPSIVTVHNVPPQECGLVGPGASIMTQVREAARLKLVGWKNQARIRAHCYDGVIVPSEQVHKLLSPMLKGQGIDVIGHGPTCELRTRMSPRACRRPKLNQPLRLLTVGGYAPHKRQHLIPEVAQHLKKFGMDFEWDVVGPAGRIANYYESVFREVSSAGLQEQVRIRGAVSFDELSVLYDLANLYVQPSIEEGFCITALDAAAAGLPVIASPAGALARISEMSGGALVKSSPVPLAEAIADFVSEDRWCDSAEQAIRVSQEFSWDAAAQALIVRYASVSRQKILNLA